MPPTSQPPSREQKIASMLGLSFEVALATLLHHNRFRSLDFLQEYSRATDDELTRHITVFKRMFGACVYDS